MIYKSKKTAQDKHLTFQDRLPFWDDKLFEQANPFARSSIFSINPETNSNLSAKFKEQFILGGSDKISYRGASLNTFDEEVFKQLIWYKRGQPLTQKIKASKRRILKDLSKQANGYYSKKIEESLMRIKTGEVLVESKSVLGKLYYLLTRSLDDDNNSKFTDLLNERFEDYIVRIGSALKNNTPYAITLNFITRIDNNFSENDTFLIELDPMMVLLFDGIETTRTSRWVNSKLSKPGSKRLYQFFLSHNGRPHNIKLTNYHTLLGSNIDITTSRGKRNFKSSMKKWLEDLSNIGAIEKCWHINDDKVCNIVATNLDIPTHPSPYDLPDSFL